MWQILVRWLANRVLRDNQLNRLGVEDPYYEHVPINPNSAGKIKYKKIKRRVPEGLSANDVQVLQTVRKKAYRYDMWFSVLGLKFGLANLVGFVPIVGAAISVYWSVGLYLTARKIDDGLPLDLQLIFFFNLIVDFLLSLIPVVGEFVEIGYKANLRNFLLLEKHLYRVGQKNLHHIEPEEVRPGFLNEKVQPFMDENVKPRAVHLGESLKHFVMKDTDSAKTSEPTIQKTEVSASGLLDKDDDARSVRSLKRAVH